MPDNYASRRAANYASRRAAELVRIDREGDAPAWYHVVCGDFVGERQRAKGAERSADDLRQALGAALREAYVEGMEEQCRRLLLTDWRECLDCGREWPHPSATSHTRCRDCSIRHALEEKTRDGRPS